MSTFKLALPLTVRDYGDGFVIFDTDDSVIAACDFPLDVTSRHSPDAAQNAHAIVHACNMHERLIAALDAMVATFSDIEAARRKGYIEPAMREAIDALRAAKGGAS